jgi:hypothetical protein
MRKLTQIIEQKSKVQPQSNVDTFDVVIREHGNGLVIEFLTDGANAFLNENKSSLKHHITNVGVTADYSDLPIIEAALRGKGLRFAMVGAMNENVTSIDGWNLESDFYIAALNVIKADKKMSDKFSKIISSVALDFFDGAKPSSLQKVLSGKLIDIMSLDVINQVIAFVNSDRTRMIGLTDSPKLPDYIKKFSTAVALGVLFDLGENPYTFAKEYGDAKSLKAATDYTVARGKTKLAAMMSNKGIGGTKDK